MQTNNNKPFIITIVILLFLLIGTIFLYKDVSNKLENKDYKEQLDSNNTFASNDTTHKTVDKNGNTEFSKGSFHVEDLNDLKSLNQNLYNSVKAMNSKVFALQNALIDLKENLNQKSSGDKSSFDKQTNEHRIEWSFDTTGIDTSNSTWSRSIKGMTFFKVDSTKQIIPDKSILISSENKFNITTGWRKSTKKEGALEVVVKSNSPFFNVSNIEGAILSPEEMIKYLPSKPKKKYVFGITGSIGVGLTKTGYAFPSFNLGIGITKKIFEF